MRTFHNIYLSNERVKRSSILLRRLIILFTALIVFLYQSNALPADEYFDVILIISSNSDHYTKTSASITSTIKRKNNSLIRIRTVTLADLYSEKNTLIGKTDLFVPIGIQALKETLKYSGKTPLLSSLVSEYDFTDFIKKYNVSGNLNNIGAVYIDQPIKRHLIFSRLILPHADRFGFIVSGANKITINKLHSISDGGINNIEITDPGDNIISSLNHALVNADALIALPDPIVYNLRTTRNILLSTYRKRIPVIGFSKSYAKAGALAAIYSTPDSIGRQTGELISHLVNNSNSVGKIGPLPRTTARYFSISVNKRVSRSLHIPVPDEESLKKQLLQLEGGRHE